MSEFLMLYLPPVIGMAILAGFFHARLLEKPTYRGWWGEYKVNFMLRLCLSGEYRVFTNAIYRGKTREESTQIDHIVVSRFGIFVLETKSFKGKVLVDPLEPSRWTQVVGRRKYQIQSPLMQNYAHVKAIQQATGVHAQKIHSYAVMAGDAQFPAGLPERVYSVWGVVRKIQSYKAPVFTRGHTDDICRSLLRRRIKGGYWAAQKHVERLNARSDSGQN
ncbi:nuclease-related domain-containing protein [Pseudomonas qingdaonensis]|uniref:nuclease-related domain-containing protein n=1 Tax=Pseudomonas qingdaonensis TaxID=2056231 RepID=UPI00265F9894|nr:nuclease-related domain-containing protein [Pseudomonas qingdaonensis]WKL67285.1 nuclease-related domain-containing protein [Pseudomonas qingdaonensis]